MTGNEHYTPEIMPWGRDCAILNKSRIYETLDKRKGSDVLTSPRHRSGRPTIQISAIFWSICIGVGLPCLLIKQ